MYFWANAAFVFKDNLTNPRFLNGSALVSYVFSHVRTLHRGTFGQDGNGSFCHSLLLNDRWNLGAPAVRPHPQEMTRLVALPGSIQHSSADINNDTSASNNRTQHIISHAWHWSVLQINVRHVRAAGICLCCNSLNDIQIKTRFSILTHARDSDESWDFSGQPWEGPVQLSASHSCIVYIFYWEGFEREDRSAVKLLAHSVTVKHDERSDWKEPINWGWCPTTLSHKATSKTWNCGNQWVMERSDSASK